MRTYFSGQFFCFAVDSNGTSAGVTKLARISVFAGHHLANYIAHLAVDNTARGKGPTRNSIITQKAASG